MLFGSTTKNPQSRFVTEIPKNLVETTGHTAAAPVKTAAQQPAKMNFDPFKKTAPKAATKSASYSVGDMVLHKVFGKGMVTSAEPMGNDTMLEVAFDKVGTKTLMANFCKMEKIS